MKSIEAEEEALALNGTHPLFWSTGQCIRPCDSASGVFETHYFTRRSFDPSWTEGPLSLASRRMYAHLLPSTFNSSLLAIDKSARSGGGGLPIEDHLTHLSFPHSRPIWTQTDGPRRDTALRLSCNHSRSL